MHGFSRDTALGVHAGGEAMGYEQLLIQLQKLLREALLSRYRGGMHADKARAQGYADGYMRALLDAGLVDRDEMLRVVADARTEVAGAPIQDRVAAAG
jgi:hypothetical protein